MKETGNKKSCDTVPLTMFEPGRFKKYETGCVTDSGKGVCVDPGEKEAILEAGGPGPPGGGKGLQLAPDSGGEGT